MDPSFHVFQSKIHWRLPSVSCMLHSSLICQCSFIILVCDKQYKLCNSTLYILFFLFPLSLFQTLSWLLYIIVQLVSVSSCIRIWVLALNDIYWHYAIYRHDVICFTCTRTCWITYCHNVHTHNPKNVNNCKHITEKAHYCSVLLLQQYLLVLGNMCNFGF
jgi:hypothetical protein